MTAAGTTLVLRSLRERRRQERTNLESVQAYVLDQKAWRENLPVFGWPKECAKCGAAFNVLKGGEWFSIRHRPDLGAMEFTCRDCHAVFHTKTRDAK